MPSTRTAHRRLRGVAAWTVLITVASLLLAPGTASAAPPPNPSNTQISAAQQAKNTLAAEVGQLGAQAAQLQTQLDQLLGAQELAEQKVALTQAKLADAKTAAQTARTNVASAQTHVARAQQAFVGYLQAAYMGSEVAGTAGSLLAAHDPNVVLEQGALHDYQSSHQLTAIGKLQQATVEKSNADSSARHAVQLQGDAASAAESAKEQAAAAVSSAQSQQQRLQVTLATNSTALHAAQLQLATLNNKRATYLAYQKEQARIAAAKAAAERRARQQAEAAAAARARARDEANRHHGSSGGGGGGSFVSPGPTGNWTPAAGQRAVDRAMQLLGVPYSYAGGNSSGPTYGVCESGVHHDACNVVGVDCSGLVMFAWAQFPFVHYAATQYEQGSVHPNRASLMPGDLVFWSSDGTVAGIHHVGIYIGHGNIIHAPQTGDLVHISTVDHGVSGYYGATRPLT